MHPYEEIRATLLRRINEGDWPAGFSVPGEEALAEEFGVARGTVRRALSSLVDAGLLERRRRSGTRVMSRSSSRSVLTIPIVREEIERSGRRYSFKLLESSVGGQKLDPAGLFSGARLRRLLCLHLSDERPFQLEERLINIAAIPAAEAERFAEKNPNEWLLEQVPFPAVRNVLRAEVPTLDDSRHLRLGPGEPVFVIKRQTRREGVMLTATRLSHPGSVYQMAAETDDFAEDPAQG